MGRVLGLDLAVYLNGFAAGDGSSTPMAGAWEFPDFGDDLGALACAYEDQLNVLCERFAPDLIAYESPILTQYDKLSTIRRIYGLGFETERFCKRRGIRCGEVDLRKVKKALAGESWASKDMMVAAALRMGVTLPATNAEGRKDAADATGVWMLGLKEVDYWAWSKWDGRLWLDRKRML